MGQIVALDSMNFIYLFEQDKRFSTRILDLFHQMESGKISVITSIISVVETLSPPKYITNEHTQSEISRFFQESVGLAVYPLNWEISFESARLRRENKFLKTPDSVQLATALINKADVFITNDQKLTGLKISGLKISSLSSTL